MKLTEAQIEAGRSTNGGWTRAQLAQWGVAWPPRKGWRQELMRGREAISSIPRAREIAEIFRRKRSADEFPHLSMAKFYFAKPFAKKSAA